MAITNVATTAIIKKTVLTGVNEQVALYPKRQSLLAPASGITVLMVAMLKTTITKTERMVNTFIGLFPPFPVLFAVF